MGISKSAAGASRSEQTARMNERDFSHMVELPLPRSSLIVTLGAATAWLIAVAQLQYSTKFTITRRNRHKGLQG
jgi:hypothetical protein